MSLIELKCSSIPTAPTNHLPDGWTLNKNTRGQKGADKTNDPLLYVCPAPRLTAGFTGLKLNRAFPRTSFPDSFCPAEALLEAVSHLGKEVAPRFGNFCPGSKGVAIVGQVFVVEAV